MDQKHYEAALERCVGLPFELKMKAYSYVASSHDLAALSDYEKPFAAELIERAGASPRRWYHGGLTGRVVGDMLLPARSTRADPRALGQALLRKSPGGIHLVSPAG